MSSRRLYPNKNEIDKSKQVNLIDFYVKNIRKRNALSRKGDTSRPRMKRPIDFPANSRPSVVFLLDHRLRRWSNINPTFSQRLVSARLRLTTLLYFIL